IAKIYECPAPAYCRGTSPTADFEDADGCFSIEVRAGRKRRKEGVSGRVPLERSKLNSKVRSTFEKRRDQVLL
ncbi:hypothetical protein ACP3V7_24270, partial [Salmonella enterica]|uniref:hypothetical protein n=1 Tax=Salmonella enterica TaxID=28901 RepID=UPI003CF7C7B9